jgi:CDP-diglyceride synthetase
MFAYVFKKLKGKHKGRASVSDKNADAATGIGHVIVILLIIIDTSYLRTSTTNNDNSNVELFK